MEIKYFYDFCKDNALILNSKKIVIVNNTTPEIAPEFKYVGTIYDKLTYNSNTIDTFAKAQ